MTKTERRFANPDVLLQSWYVLARSKELRRGKPITRELAGRRIVVYRDAEGAVRAANGRCVHLGADLGQGRVTEDGLLECPFHHWRFGTDGTCRSAPGHDTPPGRRLRTYPAMERWGLVWVYAGPEAAAWELPDIPDRFRALRVPSQHIGTHPHLVLGNVFDIEHFGALHGFRFTTDPVLERTGPQELSGRIRGGFDRRLVRVVTRSGTDGVSASFRMIGGSITWAHVTRPFEFHVLFTGRPSATGGCDTQTLFFTTRSPVRTFRALALIMSLLHDDSRILDRLQFTHAFTEADAAMATLAELVEELPVAWRRGSTGGS